MTQPTREASLALIAQFVQENNGVELADLVECMAELHAMQARVIRGERALREDAAGIADALEGNWENGDLAGAVNNAVAYLRKIAT